MNNLDTQNKEILVRKRMSAFIEALFRFFGYNFRHDDYKQLIYAEAGTKTDLEEKIKQTYDAYHYLLFNSQNPLTSGILKRFFYILIGEEMDNSMLIRMSSKFFEMNNLPTLEKAINYHLYIYEELSYLEEEQRFMISIMFFNYILAKSGIPTLRFVKSVLMDYVKHRDAFFAGDKTAMYELMLEQLRYAKVQDKDFYKKLKPLYIRDVYHQFLKDKDVLKEQYGILGISIFGSFAKENQRLDSDIDLLVVFSNDLSYEEKIKKVEDFSKFYLRVFNRFIDVLEVGEYVGDWIIKEITNYKKIF